MREPIIITVADSLSYGNYWMECIGIIDYAALIRSMSIDEVSNWMESYHPRRYFGSFMSETLHDHLDKDGKSISANRIALFIATERVNERWDFKASPYAKHITGRKRPLPIIINKAKVAKWQTSVANDILVPSWLSECHTVQEMRAADKANHPVICPNCGN